MSELGSKFYEIVHMDPESIVAGTSEEERSIVRMMHGGIALNFVGLEVDLGTPNYQVMPDKDTVVVLGGKFHSSQATMHGYNCVNRRAEGWKALGYEVIVDNTITLTDAEAQWMMANHEYFD